MPEAERQELSIRDYFSLLRRRKWVLLACIVIAPICAYAFANHEQPVYQSTASVATKEVDVASTVSGLEDPDDVSDPARIASTQIALAETVQVTASVLHRAKVRSISAAELLASSSITSNPNADILYFTVKLHDAALAVRLANAYAQQYTVFRSQLDEQPYIQARDDIQRRINQLDAQGRRTDAQALNEKAAQLQTYADLQTANAVVASKAEFAAKVSPKPKRDALFGLALGIVLGIGLAFLRDSLDTRIRTPEEITRKTGLALLARIPEPPRRLQRDADLVMLRQPSSVEAEAFRILRTNLEFAGLDRDVRSLMITSAIEKEGKSTTISNLAVVQARAGKRVVIVDLDLRRPRLDKLFSVPGQPGLTNVILGHATLEEATTRIDVDGVDDARRAKNGRNGRNGSADHLAPMEGSLDVIPSGPIPPDPGEFVATAALSRVIETLTERYDLVLVDAPPLLRVGDALTLATKVSGLLIVTRLPGMKRTTINELERVLERFPTRALGFVVTGTQGESDYSKGYYYSDFKKNPALTESVPTYTSDR